MEWTRVWRVSGDAAVPPPRQLQRQPPAAAAFTWHTGASGAPATDFRSSSALTAIPTPTASAATSWSSWAAPPPPAHHHHRDVPRTLAPSSSSSPAAASSSAPPAAARKRPRETRLGQGLDVAALGDYVAVEEMDDLLDEIINSLDEGSSSYASIPTSTATATTAMAARAGEVVRSGGSAWAADGGGGGSGRARAWTPSVSLAEGGLYVWANAARWMGAFERHGWMFTPLHPAVVSEDGLRSLLSGGGGSCSPPSSLSSSSSSSSSSWFSSFSTTAAATSPASIRQAVFDLNINTALAYGATLLANDARAEEFFDRARTALEDLLEVDDYAVAEALFALGYYLYGRGDLARFSYYITLARDICERIGACSSGVYLKCMMATVLDPSYTPIEKERMLRRYNRAVKDTPRYDDNHDRFLLDYNHHSRDQGRHHDAGINADADDVAAAITLGIGHASRVVTAHAVMDAVERMRDIDKCVTNVLMLIQLHRWMRQEAADGRILGDDAMDTVLQQWGRLLVAMEEEIICAETLPPSYKLTVTLSWICFSSEYHQRCGNTEEALRFGSKYLEHFRDTDIEHCTSSCINMAEIMINLFTESGRDDMVEALLIAARPLFERHPVCHDRAAQWWARLQEMRSTGAWPSSSSSTNVASAASSSSSPWSSSPRSWSSSSSSPSAHSAYTSPSTAGSPHHHVSSSSHGR